VGLRRARGGGQSQLGERSEGAEEPLEPFVAPQPLEPLVAPQPSAASVGDFELPLRAAPAPPASGPPRDAPGAGAGASGAPASAPAGGGAGGKYAGAGAGGKCNFFKARQEELARREEGLQARPAPRRVSEPPAWSLSDATSVLDRLPSGG
jgi:hypothetical protein